MSAQRATALVLKVVSWSEASCIVTLFTREFGKVRGVAKGGRRPKGPFDAALDLLAQVRLVFLRKSSDALDLLTEAKLQRRFRPAGRDLTGLYAGYYVAELLNEFTEDYQSLPELFDAADYVLDVLGSEPLSGESIAGLISRFELSLLQELGFAPSWDSCAACGQEVAAVGRVAFGQLDGGVLCSRCRPGKRLVASIGAEVVLEMQRYSEGSMDVWRSHPLKRQIRGQVRGVLNRYIAHQMGREPRMHHYLTILTS